MALPPKYASLEKRLGRALLSERLHRQASHYARLSHQGEGAFKLEKYIPLDRLAELGLTVLGLKGRARRNIHAHEIVEQIWHLPRLPKAFDGFRLLQLTDLHIDIDATLADTIAAKVRETPHDACVFTGDYRNSTDDDYGPSMRLMAPVLEAVSSQRWGILGNHDFIEEVWALEEAGLPVLLNESACLTRGVERLWIAGVDDEHFYGVADFAKARADVPDDDCCVLLCHSPEPHPKAAQHGFDLMLSGHTHGGQLCLPGGRHVVCPVKNLSGAFIKGRWLSGAMPGYTSRGTGSCGIPARLNCPPEITVHVLRCG
ncbi:metallophosphoesterase [Cerasicoccus fimbriatus]|uniref:metallophosphoesterase n=1 Tax=Cerasicoccus fimbriatus TaxID=3014554 RepID=UPI0022B5D8C3|nr:metallophosphoesterase [Cerasicoccus sp. TK19100]